MAPIACPLGMKQAKGVKCCKQLRVDKQMDGQIDRTSLGGRTEGQTKRLFSKVDEQTDKERAGQTELRNC